MIREPEDHYTFECEICGETFIVDSMSEAEGICGYCTEAQWEPVFDDEDY